ncbi:MAG: flagellar motor protein MotB [Candidatus Cloacimonetes bacterium]|jgi:chemotaxis protein MotB|nr:flagellar motor protein MotB [Candidatus Cloacimonadota bacterium]MDD4155596.1 flagellar motor protein MotB [Candidatus Cloacimonadota bacterium]
MAKKKKCPECPPVGAPAYMNTYGDMMTLLVTFFVLLISYSTIEQKKFTMAMTSLRGALGMMTSSQGVSLPVSKMPMFQIGKGKIDQIIESIVKQIREQLQKTGMQDQIKMTQSKDQIHFNISAPLLFESAQANVKPTADSLLVLISEILNTVPFEIRVEGHTDNLPIKTVEFPSNWELSFARGIALTRKLIDFGVSPERFQVIGYGEYRPIADNANEKGRTLNRRVEIFVNLREGIRRSLMPGE